jgi:TnpA family transposase
MPLRSIPSAAELESLLALPDTKEDLIRDYTFSDTDLSIILQRRGPDDRLGFAVQLCCMRYPGVMFALDEEPFVPVMRRVATQLKVPLEAWADYGQRAGTRREHLLEDAIRLWLPAVHNAALPPQRVQP